MKSKAVELYCWTPTEHEVIDIDWPKVHKTLGLEQTRWLLDLPRHVCQMVLEQRPPHCRLLAEFYCESTRLEYAVKFAK
jgi:hypothetical protein